MHLNYFFILFVTTLLTFSCKKNNSIDDQITVGLNSCVQKNSGGPDKISVCLDSIISDSRCPLNIQCIWKGTAIVKFSFKKNGLIYPLTLSILPLQGIAPSDTLLSGYKIRFIDFHPYPDVLAPPVPANQFKADISITRL